MPLGCPIRHRSSRTWRPIQQNTAIRCISKYGNLAIAAAWQPRRAKFQDCRCEHTPACMSRSPPPKSPQSPMHSPRASPATSWLAVNFRPFTGRCIRHSRRRGFVFCSRRVPKSTHEVRKTQGRGCRARSNFARRSPQGVRRSRYFSRCRILALSIFAARCGVRISRVYVATGVEPASVPRCNPKLTIQETPP